MKSILISIVIFSFIGIAVFGIFAMAHSMNNSHDGCIAATAKGEVCPGDGNSLQSINYHLNSFRNFSMATIGDNFVNGMLLVFLLSLIIGFRIFKNDQLKFSFLYNQGELLISRASLFQLSLIDWLSLHENSPSFS